MADSTMERILALRESGEITDGYGNILKTPNTDKLQGSLYCNKVGTPTAGTLDTMDTYLVPYGKQSRVNEAIITAKKDVTVLQSLLHMDSPSVKDLGGFPSPLEVACEKIHGPKRDR